jgi:hypothetical protein
MNQNLITLALQSVIPSLQITDLGDAGLVTFQVPSGALTANGNPDGTYVDVPGLVALEGQIAPVSLARLSATTQKALAEQSAMTLQHCLLYGYYPDAETAWRNGARVVVNGAIYTNKDVLGVESDSQKLMTRILLRVVTL